MNPTPTIRRSAGLLAALASAVLAVLTVAPAALAGPAPHHTARARVQFPPVLPPGWYKHPTPLDSARAHPALPSGLPGWQIALLVAGAIALAALAVLLLRARAARRHATATAT